MFPIAWTTLLLLVWTGKKSGYYLLTGYSKSEKVYCNMDVDGGGWTLAGQITSAGKSWEYDGKEGRAAF